MDKLKIKKILSWVYTMISYFDGSKRICLFENIDTHRNFIRIFFTERVDTVILG